MWKVYSRDGLHAVSRRAVRLAWTLCLIVVPIPVLAFSVIPDLFARRGIGYSVNMLIIGMAWEMIGVRRLFGLLRAHARAARGSSQVGRDMS